MNTINGDVQSRLESTSLTPDERRAVERLVGSLEQHLGDRLASMWLYGSRARGERPRPESDVDVIVVTTGGRDDRDLINRLSWDAAEAEGMNPVTLAVHVFDPAWVQERREIRSFFIQEVDRDKLVLAGEP